MIPSIKKSNQTVDCVVVVIVLSKLPAFARNAIIPRPFMPQDTAQTNANSVATLNIQRAA